MSSSPGAIARGSRGSRDQDEKWNKTKGRIARALIADPDIFFYWAYLSSNRGRKIAMDLSALLGLMIQGAEGRRLPQKEVPDTATAGLESATGLINEVISGGRSPSSELIRQLELEAARFTSEYLVPNFRTGARIQQKGEEANATYQGAKNSVSRAWSSLFVYIRNLRSPAPLPISRIRPVALETPTVNLQTTAGLSFPAEQACAYSLQLLAGVAAIEAMSQPIDEFTRFFTEERSSSPENIEVVELAEEGGFITKFEVRNTKTREVINPKTLRVKKQDLVDWLGYSATVSAVTSADVTLTGSQIPVGTRAYVRVKSACGEAYKILRDGINECLGDLPTSRELTQAITALEHGRSAAETRDYAKFLGEVAQCLHPLDNETLLSLERMGASPTPQGTPIAEVLLAYEPPASADTRLAAINALDSLRDDGFDRAESLLLQGDVRDFMSANASGASFSGAFDIAAAEFGDALTTGFYPEIEGR